MMKNFLVAPGKYLFLRKNKEIRNYGYKVMPDPLSDEYIVLIFELSRRDLALSLLALRQVSLKFPINLLRVFVNLYRLFVTTTLVDASILRNKSLQKLSQGANDFEHR